MGPLQIDQSLAQKALDPSEFPSTWALLHQQQYYNENCGKRYEPNFPLNTDLLCKFMLKSGINILYLFTWAFAGIFHWIMCPLISQMQAYDNSGKTLVNVITAFCKTNI